MYYYDEFDAAPECFGCDEHEKTMDNIRDFFSGVLECLYTPNKFDSDDLGRYVEEICGYLNMQMPSGKLQIRPSTTSNTSEIIEDWKVINNAYLKSLVKEAV